MSFTALNRRMLDYQISCGAVAVQILAPWKGIGYSTDVNEIIDWANELDNDAVGASAVYTNVNPCVAHHTDFRRRVGRGCSLPGRTRGQPCAADETEAGCSVKSEETALAHGESFFAITIDCGWSVTG